MKILVKHTLLVVVLIAIVFFVALVLNFISEKPAQSTPPLLFVKNVVPLLKTEQAKTEQTSFGLPLRIKIPKINVDAIIEHAGVTSEGVMDVPKGPANVAWFELGPRPGDIGSAVIAGHYGPWKNGGGSVFDNLNKLNLGDKIYVEDEKGIIITFIVQESLSYDLNADASDVFISNDKKAHLNLVTCEGVWDSSQKTYSNRLVIFADKE